MLRKSMIGTLLLIILLSSCVPVNPASDAEMIRASATSVMKTMEALSLQLTDLPTESNGSPEGSSATGTVNPPTVIPTAKPSSTPTALPEPTSAPSPTVPWNSCDQAEFVRETIADGAQLRPGTEFTKTWTLKNSGTCTWSAGYRLVFESGEPMTTSVSRVITSTEVKPGEEVKLSVKMTAPEAYGDYVGYWKLANNYGESFGLTGEGKPFYVFVSVAPETSEPFAVVSANVFVYPTGYSGYCGKYGQTAYFTGSIRTNKRGKVRYHWESSGGFVNSTQKELEFVGADSMTVSESWTFYNGYHENWVQLVIDFPNKQAFDRVRYSIECTD